MKLWLRHTLVLTLIALFGISPLLVALTAGSIASANGCALDEGSVHPCVIGGHDYGELLYTLGVLGWLSLATIPLGGLTVLGYGVFVLVQWLVRSRRASTAGTPKG